MSKRQAEQKHLERARRWYVTQGLWSGRGDDEKLIDRLAAQFAEVDQEARAAFLEEIKAEPHRAALAVLSGYPLPEEMLALQAKLREIVRAGDALRDALDEHTIKQGALLAVWDAATEGIDREEPR